MDTMKAIFSRRSVRQFAQREVEQAKITEILKAGMSGPSCVNAKDWSFIVVTNKETLNKMADINGKPAEPLRKAAFAILACGDLARSFPLAKEYWIIDVSIAAQNMILAAQSMGIGSVWLGTYPQKDRVEGQAKLFNLPETIVPHSIIAFGYPANINLEERNQYEADRVHFEKW